MTTAVKFRLVEVRKSERLPAGAERRQAVWRLTLECGHVVEKRPNKWKPGNLAGCAECGAVGGWRQR